MYMYNWIMMMFWNKRIDSGSLVALMGLLPVLFDDWRVVFAKSDDDAQGEESSVTD
jgi:hypothetical protein